MNKKGELIIGRANSCDIKIDNNLISGKHLRIFKLNSKVFVEDLNSANGTRIDGEILSKGTKKEITSSSTIILSNKIILDLNQPKIRALGIPIEEEKIEDIDCIEEEEIPLTISNINPIEDSSSKNIKGVLWGVVLISIILLLSLCFSGKFDLLCNKLFSKQEIITKAPAEYYIVSPKFMGSAKSQDSVLFQNKTDKRIDVNLVNIKIKGIPYDGVVMPLSGKERFIVFEHDTYEYKLLFEKSAVEDLDEGDYLCTIIFKISIDNQNSKMEMIKFPIKITHN